MLLYLYDKKEDIQNKEYHDYQNNISIDYPYFNNLIIDNYLNDYLEPYRNQGSDWGDLLFIDYDYEQIDEKINLLLYIYQENQNVVSKEIHQVEFNTMEGEITSKSNLVDTSLEYDLGSTKVIDQEKPMLALTFDDGPNHNTTRVLDILEKYGIKATFFILGTNIEGNEKTIERMKNLGMEIGNHMYSHKLTTNLTEEEIKEEIDKTNNLIYEITESYPTVLRPSYGTINKKIKKTVEQPIITWNVDTQDWKYHNSKRIANKVIKKASDGDIILMHDIYRATANSLEIMIPKLLNEGYQFVTVSELLYYKGIDPEKGKVYAYAT